MKLTDTQKKIKDDIISNFSSKKTRMYDMIEKFFWQGRGEIFFNEKDNSYLTPIAASKTAENSYKIISLDNKFNLVDTLLSDFKRLVRSDEYDLEGILSEVVYSVTSPIENPYFEEEEKWKDFYFERMNGYLKKQLQDYMLTHPDEYIFTPLSTLKGSGWSLLEDIYELDDELPYLYVKAVDPEKDDEDQEYTLSVTPLNPYIINRYEVEDGFVGEAVNQGDILFGDMLSTDTAFMKEIQKLKTDSSKYKKYYLISEEHLDIVKRDICSGICLVQDCENCILRRMGLGETND